MILPYILYVLSPPFLFTFILLFYYLKTCIYQKIKSHLSHYFLVDDGSVIRMGVMGDGLGFLLGPRKWIIGSLWKKYVMSTICRLLFDMIKECLVIRNYELMHDDHVCLRHLINKSFQEHGSPSILYADREVLFDFLAAYPKKRCRKELISRYISRTNTYK